MRARLVFTNQRKADKNISPTNPTPNVPLCKNCIHFVYNRHYSSELEKLQMGQCKLFGTIDPVSGNISNHHAITVRTIDHMCGYEGNHYEEDPEAIKRNVSFISWFDDLMS